MDKNEFKELYMKSLEVLGLDAQSFRVGAGGTLLMYGLRDVTGDVDGEVDAALYDKIVKAHGLATSVYGEGFRIGHLMENVDIHPVNDITEGVLIDGVWCATLESTLRLKERLNREKDQQDILNIRKMLGIG